LFVCRRTVSGTGNLGRLTLELVVDSFFSPRLKNKRIGPVSHSVVIPLKTSLYWFEPLTDDFRPLTHINVLLLDYMYARFLCTNDEKPDI